MGLTGIIYGTIVLAWAAYLVPLALRRHDQAARARSVDRFSSAMRVLSRHGAATSGRVVMAPPRVVDRVVSPGLSRPAVPLAPAAMTRPSREALRLAALRRRRVLIVLLCLAGGVAVAAGFGVVPWWSVGGPLGLVSGFLLLARRQVRHGSDAFWAGAQVAAPAPSNVIRRTPTRVESSHGAAKSPDDEPTVPLDVEALKVAASLEQVRSVAVPLPTADGGSLWDPLPITLPTYVDAPAARRTIRTIELGEPGTWSSGHGAQKAAGATAAGVDRGEKVPVEEEPARVVNG